MLQNVKNTVQHPPMTPSDIAAGLRRQIPYLVKWIFRKLHANLLSSEPDQESYNNIVSTRPYLAILLQ